VALFKVQLMYAKVTILRKSWECTLSVLELQLSDNLIGPKLCLRTDAPWPNSLLRTYDLPPECKII
jgi:hypothetical protein